MSGRRYRLNMGCHSHGHIASKRDVPQGAVLSPAPFNVAMAHFKIPMWAELKIYADDVTTLFEAEK